MDLDCDTLTDNKNGHESWMGYRLGGFRIGNHFRTTDDGQGEDTDKYGKNREINEIKMKWNKIPFTLLSVIFASTVSPDQSLFANIFHKWRVTRQRSIFFDG